VSPGAFFSPWFGIESSDNLNLIQPVNPWEGYGWSIYNEYFQWSPVYNYNSASTSVNAGDVLFGSVEYVASNQTYTVIHSDLNSGWSVTSSIPIQNGPDGNPKLFDHAWFVMEKSQWDCDQYPPDNKVTFTNILIEWDGVKTAPSWSTAYVDDNCNCRAHIVDPATVQITWDSSMQATNATGKPVVRGAAPHSLHAAL
jgi:hypothetical protein